MAAPGTARFKALLVRLPPAVKREVQAELERQAVALVATMKAAVPVKSGALRESIRAERTGRELSVSVKAGGPKTTRPVRDGASATYDYALGQEFGNAQVPSQAFFFPSYRLRKPGVKRSIGRAVKKAVGTVAK